MLGHSRSDADIDVLADYVLALLGHEGTVQEVRENCEKEIPDFLQEGMSKPGSMPLWCPWPAHC